MKVAQILEHEPQAVGVARVVVGARDGVVEQAHAAAAAGLPLQHAPGVVGRY